MTRVRSEKSAYTASGSMTRRVMSDDVTPEFRKVRDSGGLICNPASSYMEKFGPKVEFGFTGKFSRPKYPDILVTVKNLQAPAWRPTASQWAGDIKDASLNAFLAANRGEYADDAEVSELHTGLSAALTEGIASLLVTYAEMPKTIGMLLKAYDYLRRPLQDVAKKFRRMSGKERIDKVNEWWLEGRYGWRPFIYDVMSIHEAQHHVAKSRRTVRGGIPAWNYETDTIVTSYLWNGLRSDLVRAIKYSGHVSAGQTCDYATGMMHGFRKFGIYDIVGAGWDLVPYSFVVDWFINVGDAAKAMQAYALIDERIGWTKYTLKCESVLSHNVVQPGPIPYGLGVVEIVSVINEGEFPHYTLKEWNREAVTNFMPTIGLRCDLDMTKVIDGAALLRNLWNTFRR